MLFSPNRELPAKTVKWFGLSLAAMLECFAAIAWWRSGSSSAALLLAISGLLLAIVYYAVPRSRKAIIRGFFLVTWPVAAAVSTTLLAAVYFVVITPIGLLLRLLGRDPLSKSPNRSAESYWIDYPESPKTEHYFRQY